MYLRNDVANSTTELNVIPTYNKIYSLCRNESVAWQCVSEAYLSIDQRKSLAEQASYLYQKARFCLVNEYARFSGISTFSQLNGADTDSDFADNITYTSTQDVETEQDLAETLLKLCDSDIKDALAIVLSSIFERRIGIKKPLTKNSIKEHLILNKFKGDMPMNATAQKLYDFLHTVYSTH